MNKKILIFTSLIIPSISGCNANTEKIDFVLGFETNSIIEINQNVLSAKMQSSQDSFFLITHNGSSCTCWTEFQYIVHEYNENRKEEGKNYLPFYSHDVSTISQDKEIEGIDEITSGYVDLYVIIDGSINYKYSKSAKINYGIFENVDKFTKTINQYIGNEPIFNCNYVTYEYVKTNLINKDNNEFVLFTIRSGCGDCSYALPNVIYPYLKNHTISIPFYVVDIEAYKENSEKYAEVKSTLKLTSESSEYGYLNGVVPTYQYWKNGEVKDAGVYGNDTVIKDENSGKLAIENCYFDGTRSLNYTNKNLKNQMNEDGIENIVYSYFADEFQLDEKFYIPINKEAYYHTPLLESFLSYYLK